MAEKPADHLHDPFLGGLAEEANPLDPIVVAARARGLRAFRALGSLIGVTSLAYLLPAIMRGERPRAITIAVVLAVGISLAAWIIPARRHQLAAAFMVFAVGLLAVLGVWNIGPSFTMGSLYVLVPLLATFFFGRRFAFVAVGIAAIALVAIGLLSWLLGRSEVGTVPGAAIPLPTYTHLAFTTLGSTAIALAVVDATLDAVDRAIRRAREAAARERDAHARRIAAERALARAKELEAIGHLANGVAHDTRNALAVLAAGVRELRTGGPDPRAVLDDLEHAVNGVQGTIEQLLLLGRRQATGARPVALEPELHHFASALRRVIPPEVELHVECHSGAQAILDPVQLEQALLNLALNARDAMPDGGLLTLRLHDEVRNGRRHAVLEVEDSGVGMEPQVAARMFEPYFTTKPEGAGTGLGLHMVQSFVDAMGGEIEVESDVGEGTCVRLCFPMVGLVAL
ncbi:MAG TPA: ATP-binding protein [Anaeromyxobacter sp.]|nr:ATP-binding protein [Anaeromyxobacter sp.]